MWLLTVHAGPHESSASLYVTLNVGVRMLLIVNGETASACSERAHDLSQIVLNCNVHVLVGLYQGFSAPQAFPPFRNGSWLDAQFLSMITSYIVRVVTKIFYLFTVAVGTRGLSGTTTKRHSSLASGVATYKGGE